MFRAYLHIHEAKIVDLEGELEVATGQTFGLEIKDIKLRDLESKIQKLTGVYVFWTFIF